MAQLDIQDVFPDLRPITRAPSTFLLYMCGLTMYGARDRDEQTRTEVATHVLVILMVPLLALGAYRVQRQSGGMLILGRTRLSALAVAWNLLTVSALAVLIAAWSWSAHTRSPEYLAGQALERGRQALAENQHPTAISNLIQAARSNTKHSQPAREELSRCAASLPTLTDAPAVIRVLLGAGDLLNAQTLDQAVLATASQHVATKPQQALAVIDALPAKRIVGPLAEQREKVVVALHQAEPQELRWASELAVIADRAGDTARCDELLTPFAERLQAEEGVRILGAVRVQQGRIQEAYRLLKGYCQQRLPKLRSAEQNYQKLVESINDGSIAALNNGAADKSWYRSYDRADEAKQRAMVDEWVVARMKKDQRLVKAEDDLRELAAVVPVAMDLGIITLQRAQELEAAERQQELKAAEEVFLSIRGIAGASDEFRLFFGQVCWWLGRQEEGKKEFDTLLETNKRKPEMLLMVANALRDLGASGEARSLNEEAYRTAPNKELKEMAAMRRALCQTDAEDQITWLSRCDATNPHIAVQLANARGTVAMSKGDMAGAATYLRQAVDGYRALPKNASTLNNGALAAYELFDCNGDRSVLEQANNMMEEAVALQPGNAILQSNLAARLFSTGVMSVIGDRIDQAALGMSGEESLFEYCYNDQAGRQALREALKNNEDIRRTVTYLERLQVIFPRDVGVWSRALWIHSFTHDLKAMTQLRDRLLKADLDQSSMKRAYDKHLAGERDAQMKSASEATITRLKTSFTAQPLTAAVARVQSARTSTVKKTLGETVDGDALVGLADEAVALAATRGTRDAVTVMLLLRAAQQHASRDKTFAAKEQEHRRTVGSLYLLIEELRHVPTLREDPDVRRAITNLVAIVEEFPQDTAMWEWALLDAVGHPLAKTQAELLRTDELVALRRQISQHLEPYSVTEALNAYWWARIRGDAAPAKAMDPWRERGVKLPTWQ